MNTRTTPSPLSADAAELVRRLGMILAGLAALVAARFLRNPRLVGLIGPMWRRLTHVAGRVERALARPKRTLTARARRATRARAQHVQVPQGRGWLVRELGYEAVGFGLQLQHLLTEPAMQAALATMPAAGLVLRPVCRMLGVWCSPWRGPKWRPSRNRYKAWSNLPGSLFSVPRWRQILCHPRHFPHSHRHHDPPPRPIRRSAQGDLLAKNQWAAPSIISARVAVWVPP